MLACSVDVGDLQPLPVAIKPKRLPQLVRDDGTHPDWLARQLRRTAITLRGPAPGRWQKNVLTQIRLLKRGSSKAFRAERGFTFSSLREAERLVKRGLLREQQAELNGHFSTNPRRVDMYAEMKLLRKAAPPFPLPDAAATRIYLAEHFDTAHNTTITPDIRGHIDRIESGLPSVTERPTEAKDWGWDDPISLELVSDVIRDLAGRDSAPGQDSVAYKDLVGLETPLHQLFLAAQQARHLPLSLLIDRFVLIHKPTSQEGLPATFRTLAIGSCIKKVWSTCVLRILIDWAFVSGLVPDCQLGFLPGRSIADSHLIERSLIELAASEDRIILFVRLDIKAAFDTVQRPILWDFFRKHGAGGSLFDMLRQMYRDTICTYEADGERETFSTSQGVLQGKSDAHRCNLA
jgi:hypothetical protein